MKKYFAKYLPVEGEIKEGGKVLHKGKVLTTTHYDSWFNKWDFLEESIPPVDYDKNCKPVKLFLCSRDIQVGDEVIDINSNKTFIVGNIKGDEVYDKKDNWVRLKKNCIKIIGEISPEATWVKEGDEFDEDEIDIIYLDKDKNFGEIEHIKIKGPCGHFH